LIYALLVPFITVRRLSAFVLLSGTLLIFVALRFGTIRADIWQDIPIGIVRIAFSYSMGILIYRQRPNPRLKTAWAYFLPFAILPMLCADGLNATFIELFLIIVLFPILLFAGSIFDVSRPMALTLLGETSYAIYIVHLPILLLLARILHFINISLDNYTRIVGPFLIIGLIGLTAWLDRRYDKPIRRTLTELNNRSSPSRR
jgi:peptidoglycan/LPS O-acetylase OafA/YrhL